MPGQQRGDVAVLPAVANEEFAEAGPAGRDLGDDPRGDGVAGLPVRVCGTLSMMSGAAAGRARSGR